MSVNPNYDPWETDELINRHQLKGAARHELDFVMDGLGLTDAGGLLLEVGSGFAYIAGYEVELDAPDFVALADASTNHVFFGFVRTPDPAPPLTSVLDIAPDLVVNTTGISPGTDYIKLGEVDTAAGAITDIRGDDNRRQVHGAKLAENLGGNHKQIERMVAHKGAVLPSTAPPTEDGQLFYRITDKKYFIFNGVAWIELAIAAAPPPPGAIAVVNGEVDILEVGEIVRVEPGTAGTVIRASAAAEVEADGVGTVVDPIPPAGPGTAATVQGILVTMQFETGLALAEAEEVYLSATVAAAATNIQTIVIGTVVKVMGIIWDATGYIGTIPADSKVVVLLQIDHAVVVS